MEVPSEQSIAHDGVELTDHVWLRPSVALKDYDEGRIGMVLPQIMTLVELSRFKTVAQVLQSTSKRSIPANLTKLKSINGQDVEVMPDGSVYENARRFIRKEDFQSRGLNHAALKIQPDRVCFPASEPF